MNLIVSPTSGISSETIFSVSLLSKYLFEYRFNKLYYKYIQNGIEKTVELKDINNSENEIKFKFELLSENLDSLPNPLSIQVFAEVTNLIGNKEVLKNEIKIYTNKLNLDFNVLISSVLNSYNDINNLTAEDKQNLVAILDELNLFNDRIEIGNDQVFSVPVINDEGLLIIEEPVCQKDYCNGNGQCMFIEANQYCYCYEGFAGKRCQFTDRNHELLKNYFKNITNNLIANEVSKPDINKNDTIVLFHNHIKSTQNLLEEIEDLNNYVLILENLIRFKKDSASLANTNNDEFNSSLIMSIINNILSLTEQNLIKTKIDNVEMKLNKRIVNYKKASKANLAKTLIMNNFNNTHIHKNEIANNKTKTKARYLDEINENANENTTDFSLDKIEFSLDINQLNKFSNEINNIKKSIVQFTNQRLNSMNSSEILKISNKNFDIQAKKLSLENLINFNKENLFIQRRLHKNSYFDLVLNGKGLGGFTNKSDIKSINEFKDILTKNLRDNNINLDECFGKINLIYIYNKNPTFNLGFLIANNSLTSSHLIEFFDCNFNKIDFSKLLNGKDTLKITHYLPVITKNKNFINNFNLNPEKYIKIKEKFEEMIPPFFVFQNGTIDRNPDLDYQINTYHNSYSIRLLNEKDSFSAKSISKSGYLIAESKTTGEFFSSIERNKQNKIENNLFFLKYPQIFYNAENYLINRCFYALALLIFSNILLILITLKCKRDLNGNITATKYLYEKEKLTLLNDEAIFRQYFDTNSKNEESILRYNFVGMSFEKNLNNTSKNFTASQNAINSNKILEFSKINLPNNEKRNNINKFNNNNNSDNVEIELHVTKDFENRKHEESKTENKDYTVVQNLGNLDSLEKSEIFKTAENKKNDEEIKRIIGDSLNNKKKAHTFKNKSIKTKREEKDVIPAQEIEREMDINLVANKNQTLCCSGRLRSYLFFVFERNIYSCFGFVVSAFNPRCNHITKVFTLIYLLSGFSALFVGLIKIDFSVI